MAGRPSRLTPEVEGRIVAVVRLGVPRTIAAEVVRIGQQTLRDWMKRGEQPGERNRPYRNFRAAVERAESEVGSTPESVEVLLYRTAMAGSVSAAIKVLERRWPERWASGRPRAVRPSLPSSTR
jgi:transposase